MLSLLKTKRKDIFKSILNPFLYLHILLKFINRKFYFSILGITYYFENENVLPLFTTQTQAKMKNSITQFRIPLYIYSARVQFKFKFNDTLYVI